jgi:hypothetical protein
MRTRTLLQVAAVSVAVLVLSAIGASSVGAPTLTTRSPNTTALARITPQLESVGQYGDDGYASSPAEEATLGKIAVLATRLRAIGSYRVDASTMSIRLSATATPSHVPASIGGFAVILQPSQFTRASLRTTLRQVGRIARLGAKASADWALFYDAGSDSVTVEGELSAATVNQLNQIPGVAAAIVPAEFQA